MDKVSYMLKFAMFTQAGRRIAESVGMAGKTVSKKPSRALEYAAKKNNIDKVVNAQSNLRKGTKAWDLNEALTKTKSDLVDLRVLNEQAAAKHALRQRRLNALLTGRKKQWEALQAQMGGTIDSQQKNIANLGGTIDSQRQNIANLGTQLKSKGQVIDDLTAQLQSKTDDLNSMGGKLKDARAESAAKYEGWVPWATAGGTGALGLGGGYLAAS